MGSRKILVVADTHHVIAPLLKALKNERDLDHFVFLGDYAEDGEMIRKELNIPGTIIKGNGDWATYYKESDILKIKEKRILLLHGHKLGVKRGLQRLYYHAAENQVDGVLFAHTHVPMASLEGGIFFMNPGSPSYPRGGNIKGSYGILHVGDDISGEIKILEQERF